MKGKRVLPVLFLATAAFAMSACGGDGSNGSGKTEQSGIGSETPREKTTPTAGSSDTSKAGEGLGSGMAQADKDSSTGGSQSKATGSGAETSSAAGSSPSSESPSTGSTDASKAGPSSGSGMAQADKDTAVGGSQSAGTGSAGSATDTPLRDGTGSAKSADTAKAGQPAGSATQAADSGGQQQDVRQVQEALKSQGQDPGPIDGIMGPRTRQALREFQSKNGIKQTGTLDDETKEKLNIEDSSSGTSAGSATRSGSTGKGDSATKQSESSPAGK